MNESLGFQLGMCSAESGIKKRGSMYLQYERNNTAKTFPKVIVLNGGSKDCGGKVIKLVKNEFKTDKVDLLISTTPNINHGLGLLEIITHLNVGEIWMHRPWLYIDDFAELVKNAGPLDNKLQYNWKMALPVFMEIETIATEKGIAIKQPFTGLSFDNGIISVLGPSGDYYQSLINSWRKPKESSIITGIKTLFSSKKQKKTEGNNPENNPDVTCLFSGKEKYVLTEDQFWSF